MFYKVPTKKVYNFFNFPIKLDGLDISFEKYNLYKENYEKLKEQDKVQIFEDAIDSEFNFEQKNLLQIDLHNFEDFSHIEQNTKNISIILALLARGNTDSYIKTNTKENFEKYFHGFYEKQSVDFIIQNFFSEINSPIQIQDNNTITIRYFINNEDFIIKNPNTILKNNEIIDFLSNPKNLIDLKKINKKVYSSIPKEALYHLDLQKLNELFTNNTNNEISEYIEIYAEKLYFIINEEQHSKKFPNQNKMKKIFESLFQKEKNIFEFFVFTFQKQRDGEENLWSHKNFINSFDDIDLFKNLPNEQKTTEKKLFHLSSAYNQGKPGYSYFAKQIEEITKEDNIFCNKTYIDIISNTMYEVLESNKQYFKDVEKTFSNIFLGINTLEKLDNFLKTSDIPLSLINQFLNIPELKSSKEGVFLSIKYNSYDLALFKEQKETILNIYKHNPEEIISYCMKHKSYGLLMILSQEKIFTPNHFLEYLNEKEIIELMNVSVNTEHPIHGIIKEFDNIFDNQKYKHILRNTDIINKIFEMLQYSKANVISNILSKCLQANQDNSYYVENILSKNPYLYKHLTKEQKTLDNTLTFLRFSEDCTHLEEIFKEIPKIFFKDHEVILKILESSQLKKMTDELEIPINIKDNTIVFKILEKIEQYEIKFTAIQKNHPDLFSFIKKNGVENSLKNYRNQLLQEGILQFTSNKTDEKKESQTKKIKI